MRGTIRTRKASLVGGVVLLAVLTLSFSYWLNAFGGLMAPAQGQAPDEPEFACSGDEEQVRTFSGSQDQTTPEFEITGADWRFIVDGEVATQSSGIVTVSANPGAGIAILTVDPEARRTGTADSSIIDGPGTFSLDIEANGVNYEVLVCQSRTPGGGGPTTPAAPKTPAPPAPKVSPPAPKTPPQPPPPQRDPDPPLFKAGGTQRGPVPLMPGRGCPREFPTLRDGACYS